MSAYQNTSIGTFDSSTFQTTPLRGVRAFLVGPDGGVGGPGSLHSIHRAHHWQPGENKSRCTMGDFQEQLRCFDHALPKHDMEECTCGFYAFLDGSADYYNADRAERIEGVVEAYGHVYLYSRGFRASKARIVALCIPPSRRRRAALRWRQRFVRWYGHHFAAGLWLVAGGGFVAYGSLTVGAMHVIPMPWSLLLSAIAALCIGSITLQAHHALLARSRAQHGVTGFPVDDIAAEYPDVPIFDSRAAMLRAFPTDDPPEVVPESDLFWKGAAS